MKRMRQIIIKLKIWFKNAYDYVTVGIWKLNIKDLAPKKAFFVKALKVGILSSKDFIKDECALRASALTYYSLLSVVPVLAMIFGVAKGFGLETALERELTEALKGQEAVLQQILSFAHQMLEKTQGGVIAGVGFIILIFTVMQLLNNIEEAFNSIWHNKKSRSLVRKATDYTTILIISPILFAASSGITLFIKVELENISQNAELISYFSGALLFLLNFMPYAVIWALFTMLYMIMPNVKVKFSSALIAGIIAGTIYQVVQWIYISFQIGVSRYNAIYGSFAALPLFLIWLQISWIIALAGAELSYAIQNVKSYESETQSSKIKGSTKKKLSLLIVNLIVARFIKAEQPYTINKLSEEMNLSSRLISSLVEDLIRARIVIEAKYPGMKESGFQPAQDPQRLTIGAILKKLENIGEEELNLSAISGIEKIEKKIEILDRLIESSEANVLISNI